MAKKLERWTPDCAFARLAKLHNFITVGFATTTVWEITPNDNKVWIRKEGHPIGVVDIAKGTCESECGSPMFRTMIQNLVDRINEGKNYATYPKYAKAIENAYLELARKANDRFQEVYEALYPERVGKIYR